MNELKELVLRNIGRNVANFQKIEAMLKFLIANTNFESSLDDLSETLADRERVVEKKTLGNLVKQHFDAVYENKKSSDEAQQGEDEARVSLSLSVDIEEQYLASRKDSFELMVAERNKLIHHMLARFDPESEDSCKALIAELDKQHDLILAEFDRLKSLMKGHCQSVSLLSKAIAGDFDEYWANDDKK